MTAVTEQRDYVNEVRVALSQANNHTSLGGVVVVSPDVLDDIAKSMSAKLMFDVGLLKITPPIRLFYAHVIVDWNAPNGTLSVIGKDLLRQIVEAAKQ